MSPPLAPTKVRAVVVRFCLQNDDVEGGLLGEGQCAPSASPSRSATLAACRRAALSVAMVVLAVLLASLVAFFLGWASLLQLVVVASVVYLCTGRRYRWFYVAAKTAPRDLK